MTDAEQSLIDAKAALGKASTLLGKVWGDTERQRQAAILAYELTEIRYDVAKEALAEESA